MNSYLVLVFGLLFIASSSSQSCSKTKSCDTPSCCSEWGFCGYGPDFCGSSCIRDCDKRPECGQYSATPECPLKVCCSQFGFCGTTADFCSSQCQSNCKAPAKRTCSSDSASVRVGYYASWSRDRTCHPFFASNINPRSYTHLNYAFGQISGGIMIQPTGNDLSEIKAFQDLKSINANLKTLISVGGWAFNDPGPTQQEFHNIILTQASRSKFINSVQSYLETYGFNGIDIDYEYPVAPDRGGRPEDKQNFLQLVKEMRAAFGSKYLITIAAPASYWYLQHFAIGEMSKYLDFINIMTYDIHGTWDADIASLGAVVRSHTNIKEVESALELFLRDGVPSEKLVLGLAYYGRSFQLANPSCNRIGCAFKGPARSGECTNSPGTLAWFEINDIIASTGSEPVYDSDSMSKILVFGNDQWVAYDDDETLLLRQNYAGANCLLGTMVWSIDQGVVRASSNKSLTRSGSMNMNFVYLFIQLLSDSQRWLDISAEYPYVGDEINGESVTISRTDVPTTSCSYVAYTPIMIATPTSTCSAPSPTPTPIDSIHPSEFWASIEEALRSDPAISEYPLNQDPLYSPATDPTTLVLIRYLPSGAFRIEYAEAFVYYRHLNQPRSNFNDGQRDHMEIYLDAQRPFDEAGHIFGAAVGGRAVLSNLVPQHRYVNRNVGGRGIVRGWLDAEYDTRFYLNRERRENPNYLNSYVRLRVAVFYETTTSGRPRAFSLSMTNFRNGNEYLSNSTDSYMICNGGPDSFSCPPYSQVKKKPKK